jgi:hypothetical protein
MVKKLSFPEGRLEGPGSPTHIYGLTGSLGPAVIPEFEVRERPDNANSAAGGVNLEHAPKIPESPFGIPYGMLSRD